MRWPARMRFTSAGRTFASETVMVSSSVAASARYVFALRAALVDDFTDASMTVVSRLCPMAASTPAEVSYSAALSSPYW